MKLLLLSLTLISALASAETTEEPAPPPSKRVLQTALSWMQSEDPARRLAAYRSVHLLGEEALPGFKIALKAALKFHEKRLGNLLNGSAGDGNPYRKLGEALDELATERPRVYALIKTDYKKDSGKIAMLRNEVNAVTRIYDRAKQLTKADTSKIETEVDGVALALVEIQAELKRFEAHNDNEGTTEDERPIKEQKRDALKETFDGDLFLRDKASASKFRTELEARTKVESDNKGFDWANNSQKSFANVQNDERAVMGLNAFLLEERLSAAATGHSRDMKSVGFFAHTSPVKGKASPGDRARLAKFQGGWTGENIFVGSASHISAYNAWFASDGHRFIMFTKGPNRLGLGLVGSHWTLMTGRQ